MLKAGNLARREDRRVRGVKIGKSRLNRGISHVCLILLELFPFVFLNGFCIEPFVFLIS